MPTIFLILLGLFSTSSFAGPLTYSCKVTELPVTQASLQKTVELGGLSGEVVREVAIKNQKYTVQLELYFQNIQIHLVDQNQDILLTSTATDTTPTLSVTLRDTVLVSCLRK